MEQILGIALYSGNILGDINELHDLLQNLHPKIQFTMEHSLKELPYLDILIKCVDAKSSQTSTTN